MREQRKCATAAEGSWAANWAAENGFMWTKSGLSGIYNQSAPARRSPCSAVSRCFVRRCG